MDWTNYLSRTFETLLAVPPAGLDALVATLHRAREGEHTVFTCGNGGSASAASHLAQDLSKGTLLPNCPRMRVVCLCDSLPSITAWANDEGYEHVFAEQLKSLGRPGDVLIAISGSGNSKNVLHAVTAAHHLGLRTWGITGFDGGTLLTLAHRCIHVACDDMGMVEAAHGVIFHWLIGALREAR